MALALVLRNASRLNGTGVMATAYVTPLKAYGTLTGSSRGAVIFAAKPALAVVDKLTIPPRCISSSTTNYAAVAVGNHHKIWGMERIVSTALLATIPAAFLYPSQVFDALMSVSVVLHTHWGVENIITDYMAPGIGRVAHWGLLLLSVCTLGGLFYLIFNDIGVAKAVKKFWAVKSYVEPPPPPPPQHRKGIFTKLWEMIFGKPAEKAGSDVDKAAKNLEKDLKNVDCDDDVDVKVENK